MTVLKIIPILFVVFFLNSCKNISEEKKVNLKNSPVQVQGHRGDRGNFPENSIPAFISAVEKGADVLELDVVISKDKKVVVSHEPYMSSLFTSIPSGDSIRKLEERSFNMYQMTYDSIRQFDVGSRGNRLFSHQKKISTYKPLLSEVIDTVQSFIASNNLPPVKYNIELKSEEEEYEKYQPSPEEFIELVMEVINEKEIEDKIYIQSFDPNILNLMNDNYPGIPTAYLVYQEGIDKNLSLLKFVPDIYSPNFELVKNEKFVDSVRLLDMKLIPWTVNDTLSITKMMELQVDGIISDYPERVIKLRKSIK